MSIRRVAVLLGKELFQGPKNFLFIYGVIAPIVISLVVSLVFGTIFTSTPSLGIVDRGDSQLVAMIGELGSVDSEQYASLSDMRRAVESGAVDMGIVLPEGFDESVTQGEETEITVYVWGESLARNRTILYVTVADQVRALAGQEVPVEIETITIGDEESIPWTDRLLPFIVLIAMMAGGCMLPASSVVDERQKRTLDALVVTPTTAGEVFLSKGLLGVILSLFMGILILVLNQAFGAEPGLLVLVLALGSVTAAEFGLVLGALVKDITTLFAVIKAIGIFLFAPALIYLFPQIPQWIGKIFPTYYLVQPLVELSQRGGGWPDIATSVFVLIGLDLALVGLVMLALRRTRQRAA